MPLPCRPDEGSTQTTEDRRQWRVATPALPSDFAALRACLPGDILHIVIAEWEHLRAVRSHMENDEE